MLKQRLTLPPFPFRGRTMEGCVFYAPLWHEKSRLSPFPSLDHSHTACTVTGTTWGSQGRVFGGSDNILTALFPVVISPPFTIITWAKMDVLDTTGPIFDGGSYLECYLYRFVGDNSIYFNNGGQIGPLTATTTNWNMYTAIVNGANSSISVNLGAPVAGAMGAQTLSRLNLGQTGDNSSYLSGIEGEVIVFSKAISTGGKENIYSATKWRYQ